MSYRKIYPGYFVVFGAFLLHLSTGNLYTYSHISPYLVKFMNSSSYDVGSVDNTNFIWVFSLSIFGLGSAVTLGGLLSDNIGPSLTVLLGGWFMSLNVLIMSLTLKSYLWVVIMSYGLCTGIGSGLVYGVAIGTACQWFPQNYGLVSGIVASGFGLSAFVFDFIQTKIIKDCGIQAVPLTYIIIGTIYFGIQFIGSLLLIPHSNRASDENTTVTMDNSTKLIDFACDQNSFDTQIKPHQLYLELDYWVLWITMALLSSCLTLIISVTPDFAVILRIHDESNAYYLTIAISAGALCNSFGRILWGFLIDKIHYKTTMLILTLSLSVSFGTFYVINVIQDPNNTDNEIGTLIYFYVWIALLHFIPSGMFSIFPKVCSKLFGCTHFMANYGMLFTAYSFAGLVTGTIYTFSSHSCLGICIAGCVMSLVAGLVTIVFRGKSLVHREAILS